MGRIGRVWEVSEGFGKYKEVCERLGRAWRKVSDVG